jgi:hypothetical protein
VLVGVAVAVGPGASGSRARATAGPAEDAAAKARVASLTARVREWFDTRKRLVRVDCPKCRGWGRVEDRSGRGAACPRCDGAKQVLASDAYRKAHYDFMSPAYRGRDGAMDAANAAYKEANAARRDALYVNAYRLDRVELVGVNGGSAWVFEGTDSVSRESRWLQLTDPTTKKLQWFVYAPRRTARGRRRTRRPDPGGAAAKREPLAAGELEALRKAVRDAGSCPRSRARGASTARSSSGVRRRADRPQGARRERGGVFRLTGVVLAAGRRRAGRPDRVLARWRDKFGTVTKRQVPPPPCCRGRTTGRSSGAAHAGGTARAVRGERGAAGGRGPLVEGLTRPGARAARARVGAAGAAGYTGPT